VPALSFLSDLRLARIAAIGAICAALGLAGCGRKGGLDPPPAALAEPAALPAAAPEIGPDGQPIPPPPPPPRGRRTTPIDFLLN
jgi:predicted small lipoprotein YifL